MKRPLQVLLIINGLIWIIYGLGFIFFPELTGISQQFADWPGNGAFVYAVLGICDIVPACFFIMAARDPLGNLSWVKFAITWGILCGLTDLFCALKGYVPFSQVELFFIIDMIFAAGYLIFYPWRGARDKSR